MLNILIEAFAAIVVLLPVFLLLNLVRFHNGKRTVLYFLFALYLAAAYHVVGLPTVQFLVFDVNLNLVPFLPMSEDLRGSILNVLLFVPLGFFLPLLWQKYRNFKSTVLFGLGTTVSIELLQILTWRVTDINDIITNFLGTVIGWLVFRPFRTLLHRKLPGRKQTGDLAMILLTVLCVIFFLQPPVASFLYAIT